MEMEMEMAGVEKWWWRAAFSLSPYRILSLSLGMTTIIFAIHSKSTFPYWAKLNGPEARLCKASSVIRFVCLISPTQRTCLLLLLSASFGSEKSILCKNDGATEESSPSENVVLNPRLRGVDYVHFRDFVPSRAWNSLAAQQQWRVIQGQ